MYIKSIYSLITCLSSANVTYLLQLVDYLQRRNFNSEFYHDNLLKGIETEDKTFFVCFLC
jgi:hypothetical protein